LGEIEGIGHKHIRWHRDGRKQYARLRSNLKTAFALIENIRLISRRVSRFARRWELHTLHCTYRYPKSIIDRYNELYEIRLKVAIALWILFAKSALNVDILIC
jgi:hypothetical protein